MWCSVIEMLEIFSFSGVIEWQYLLLYKVGADVFESRLKMG